MIIHNKLKKATSKDVAFFITYLVIINSFHAEKNTFEM